MLGNRFRQPLMEMVCNRSVYTLSNSYLAIYLAVCLALVYTLYGSGRQPLYAT